MDILENKISPFSSLREGPLSTARQQQAHGRGRQTWAGEGRAKTPVPERASRRPKAAGKAAERTSVQTRRARVGHVTTTHQLNRRRWTQKASERRGLRGHQQEGCRRANRPRRLQCGCEQR